MRDKILRQVKLTTKRQYLKAKAHKTNAYKKNQIPTKCHPHRKLPTKVASKANLCFGCLNEV